MTLRTEGRGQWPQGQGDKVNDLKDRGTRSVTSRTEGRGQWPQVQRDEVNDLRDRGTRSMTSRTEGRGQWPQGKKDEVNDRSRCSPADRSRSGTCSSRTGSAPPPSLRSSTSSLQVMYICNMPLYKVDCSTVQDINNKQTFFILMLILLWNVMLWLSLKVSFFVATVLCQCSTLTKRLCRLTSDQPCSIRWDDQHWNKFKSKGSGLIMEMHVYSRSL
jgi:hypothetical protein